ncbi:actin-binding Rho-activating protein-like isoform X2 [Photinus pyralis]|uniref:actin-binding Rho-activating protein-like isoform X2 n=1 Tax=Photinus pyralis TaxID=7054 RepID=UPI0012673B22|nr:actin-binding Rho-activating protein-like isoform X2 [Photinus pyralis]
MNPQQSCSLKDRVALFNTFAKSHVNKQSINPFSNDIGNMQRRKFSKEEYGRPEKGSKSEIRGFKASLEVCKEMLELCEIINKHGEPLFTLKEKKNDPRKVISFGELFIIYTTVSSQLVGMLLRTRKHNLVAFEGECLFQRRDDHVPIILLKPIEEIRQILNRRINETLALLDVHEKPIDEFYEKEQ